MKRCEHAGQVISPATKAEDGIKLFWLYPDALVFLGWALWLMYQEVPKLIDDTIDAPPSEPNNDANDYRNPNSHLSNTSK
jgi:hypothetical protein